LNSKSVKEPDEVNVYLYKGDENKYYPVLLAELLEQGQRPTALDHRRVIAGFLIVGGFLSIGQLAWVNDAYSFKIVSFVSRELTVDPRYEFEAPVGLHGVSLIKTSQR
jgi:hypothetical protein